MTPRGGPEPELIKGGMAVDDRGAVRFVNDFDLSSVRRMYTVSNHAQGTVRVPDGVDGKAIPGADRTTPYGPSPSPPP